MCCVGLIWLSFALHPWGGLAVQRLGESRPANITIDDQYGDEMTGLQVISMHLSTVAHLILIASGSILASRLLGSRKRM